MVRYRVEINSLPASERPHWEVLAYTFESSEDAENWARGHIAADADVCIVPVEGEHFRLLPRYQHGPFERKRQTPLRFNRKVIKP